MMTLYLSLSFFPLRSGNIISLHKNLWKCPILVNLMIKKNLSLVIKSWSFFSIPPSLPDTILYNCCTKVVVLIHLNCIVHQKPVDLPPGGCRRIKFWIVTRRLWIFLLEDGDAPTSGYLSQKLKQIQH